MGGEARDAATGGFDGTPVPKPGAEAPSSVVLVLRRAPGKAAIAFFSTEGERVDLLT